MNEHIMNMLEMAGGAVIILVLGVILIRLILKVTRKTLEKTSLDGAVHTFIISAVRILLYIVLVVVLLTQLKVPTTPLVTVLGAGGAAIALALKDSLGNIAGGLLILVNQPFRKGDEVDIVGINGEVEDIDLFVTTLRTFDNKTVCIPNGTINTSVIVNHSGKESRRVDLRFGIRYDSDISQVRNVLMAVADSNPDIYKEPAPLIFVASQDERAVYMDLKVWCSTGNYYTVKNYLNEQVKLAFDEANISIPYPQVDVHVVK